MIFSTNFNKTSGNLDGFTFVELMIGIIIISMFSVVGISSFQRFFSSQQMLNIKTKILNQIDTENNSLASGEISSYRITFATGSKALIINENFYKNKQPISFNNFDYTILSGSIVTNNSSTGNWVTKTFVDNMIHETYLLNGSGNTLNLSFSGIGAFENILIESTIDSTESNNIKIVRIDYSGDAETNFQDTVISTLSGASQYSLVTIENIMGNKKMLASTGGTDLEIENIDVGLTRGSQDLTFKLEK